MYVCLAIFPLTSCSTLCFPGARPGKQVQLLEGEIKMLCVKARDIFMQQPILLELEAPIKICGEQTRVATDIDVFSNSIVDLCFVSEQPKVTAGVVAC